MLKKEQKKEISLISGKLTSALTSLPAFSDWQRDMYTFVNMWYDDLNSIEVKTSGSTGLPKLIRHKKQAMLASAKMTCDFLGLKPGMSALICISTKNIAGMMMVVRAIERDLKVIMVEPGSHPLKDLDPGTSSDFCAMVPAQVYNSLSVPEEREKLANIRNLIIGGAPVSYTLQEQIKKLPGNVYATFGMTETMSHIALRKLNGADASDEFTLLDGITIEAGENGNLIIHATYLSDEPIITNDLAEITGQRTFRWLGRLDHVINSGGFKIIPEQLEEKMATVMAACFPPEQLSGKPDHMEALASTRRYFITSLPDEKLGEKPVLVIELPAERAYSKKEISDCLLEKLPHVLARHEMPREFFFTEKFIETPTRKIIRSATMKRIITPK